MVKLLLVFKIILVSLITITALNAQNLNWLHKIGGNGGGAVFDGAMTMDESGNIYIVGAHGGSFVMAGSGSGSNCCAVGVLGKLDANGNELWATYLSAGQNAVLCNAVALDKNGEILVMGEFNGVFTLGQDILEHYSSGKATFLAKFTNNGDPVWAKKLFSGQVYGEKIITDADNNIYVGGIYYSNFNLDSISFVASAKPKGFLAKLDPDGNAIWGIQLGDPNVINEQLFFGDLVIDHNDIIYWSSSVNSNIFQVGNETFNSNGNNQIIKLDTSGNVLKAKFYSWNNFSVKIAANPFNHKIYITGVISATYGYHDESFDIPEPIYNHTTAIVCMDTNLVTTNIVQFGSNTPYNVIKAIAPSPSGVVVTGIANGTSISGTYVFNEENTEDNIFIAKFGVDLTPHWARSFKGGDFSNSASGIVQRGNAIYAFGDFGGSISMDNQSIGNFFGKYYLAKFNDRRTYQKIAKGKVFEDNNGNGIQDAGEPPLINELVIYNPASIISNTDTSGFYQFALDTGAVSIGHYSLKQYWEQTHPLPAGTYSLNVPIGSGPLVADTLDFGLRRIPGIRDLELHLTPAAAFRPGFENCVTLTVKNVGNVPVLDSVIMFHFSPILSIDSVSLNYSALTDSTISWHFDSIGLDSVIQIKIWLDVPFSIGDSIDFEGIVYPLIGDETPMNNLDHHHDLITGSFDPNDKLVQPSGIGDLGALPFRQTEFVYTVRFQNTGNDTAFTVVVVDTIDSNLDMSTFINVASSHPYTMEASERGVIKWTFNHILLPDSSTNYVASNGFIKYKIKSREDIASGSIIKNKAAIFFDYNLPIITNEVVNKLGLLHAMSLPADDAICQGDSIEIVPTVQSNFDSFTYQWLKDGLPIATTPTLVVQSTGMYYLKVWPVTDTSFLAIDSIYIKVDTVQTALLVADQTVCLGDAIHLSDNSISNGAIANRQLSFGDGHNLIFLQPFATSHVYSMPGSYTIILKAETGNGCTDADTTLVEVLPLPSFELPVGLIVCDHEPVTIDPGLVGAAAYMWSTGDTTVSLSVTAGGNYWLTVTDALGCMYVSSTIVAELDSPIAGFDYQANYLGVEFFNNTVFGDSNIWDFGDGSSSVQENPVHVYADSGMYEVCLIAFNDCGSDTICANFLLQDSVSAANELSLASLVRCYPNPFKDDLIVDTKFNTPVEGVLEIYTIFGQRVIGQSLSNNSFGTSYLFDTTELPPGLYWLVVKIDNELKYYRLCKA